MLKIAFSRPTGYRQCCLFGFTLIELVVVVALIGLLLFIGMPSATVWIRNTMIRNAAESIHGCIQIARIEALKRNTNVSCWLVSSVDDSCALSSTVPLWVVSFDNPAGHCSVAPSDTTAPRIVQKSPAMANASNVLLLVQPSGANQVTFNGLGQAVSSGTSLTQININSSQNASKFRSLRINVSTSGSTRICDPAVTAADDPRKC